MKCDRKYWETYSAAINHSSSSILNFFETSSCTLTNSEQAVNRILVKQKRNHNNIRSKDRKKIKKSACHTSLQSWYKP